MAAAWLNTFVLLAIYAGIFGFAVGRYYIMSYRKASEPFECFGSIVYDKMNVAFKQKKWSKCRETWEEKYPMIYFISSCLCITVCHHSGGVSWP